MAAIVVTEYAELATGAKGFQVQAGQEPSIQVQTVASAAISSGFSASTKFVMITSTAEQRIKFGGTGTVADSTSTLILAGERFFGVFPDHIVSNLDNV